MVFGLGAYGHTVKSTLGKERRVWEDRKGKREDGGKEGHMERGERRLGDEGEKLLTLRSQ